MGTDEIPDTNMTVLQTIGHLGDLAMELVLSAHQSVDTVVNPEAVAALSMMSSSVLQAAAARLRTLPPACAPETEWRRTAMALLTRSLQMLPQAAGHCSSMNEAS